MKYDFICARCKSTQTVDIDIGDVIKPPLCKPCGLNMRQQLYAPGIAFKGDGWAKKDKK